MVTLKNPSHWRKSSRCGESGSCVEVAFTADGVLVRQAGEADGAVLAVSSSAWRLLIAGIREGQFDLEPARD